MTTDYWQKFTESGRVEDYLLYRSSISQKRNDQSDTDNNRNSNKRDKDQGK